MNFYCVFLNKYEYRLMIKEKRYLILSKDFKRRNPDVVLNK